MYKASPIDANDKISKLHKNKFTKFQNSKPVTLFNIEIKIQERFEINQKRFVVGMAIQIFTPIGFRFKNVKKWRYGEWIAF